MKLLKPKKKTWASLKEEKCPKCEATLMKDLFNQGLLGCACGFILDEKTKENLVQRDN